MSSGLPTPEADTGEKQETPFPPDGGDTGATNPSNAGPSAPEGVQAVRNDLVASLARTLDPVAYDPQAVAVNLGQSWDRFTRRQVAEAHAEAAIADGWVRVSEDDDTIARVTAAVHGEFCGCDDFDGHRDGFRHNLDDVARAAVRALREET